MDDEDVTLRRLVEASGITFRTRPGSPVVEIVRHGEVVATCALYPGAVDPSDPASAVVSVAMSLEDILWGVLERDPPEGMRVVRPARPLPVGGG